jgi:hypothetical protein
VSNKKLKYRDAQNMKECGVTYADAIIGRVTGAHVNGL